MADEYVITPVPVEKDFGHLSAEECITEIKKILTRGGKPKPQKKQEEETKNDRAEKIGANGIRQDGKWPGQNRDEIPF